MFKAYLGTVRKDNIDELEIITHCNYYAEGWRWINNSVSIAA
jgi:hypothetical protein